jgi:hypothetical protein
MGRPRIIKFRITTLNYMYLVLLPLNVQHEPMQTRVEWRQRLELGVHLAQKQCRMRGIYMRLNFSSQKYVGK